MVIDGLPKDPGCYMRLPSGCPNHVRKSHLWRHDISAERKEVDEIKCQARKYYWDEYCGVTDSRVMFVPDLGDEAGSSEEETVEQTPTEEHMPAEVPKAAEEPGPAEGRGRAEPARAEKQSEDEPRVYWEEPGSAEGSEEGRKPVEASEKEKRADEVIDGLPQLPGCYMRLPSGCPNHARKSHLWRHDVSAEQSALDEARCQARKEYWDEYCGVTDSKTMFVPQHDGASKPEEEEVQKAAESREEEKPKPAEEQGRVAEQEPAEDPKPSEAVHHAFDNPFAQVADTKTLSDMNVADIRGWGATASPTTASPRSATPEPFPAEAEELQASTTQASPFSAEWGTQGWGDAATTTPDRTERALSGEQEAGAAGEASELEDLPAVIRREGTLHLERFAEVTQEALRRGALMTEERWRTGGPELAQGLKEKFRKLPVTQNTAMSRCGNLTGDERSECLWKQYDGLLCEQLDVLGLQSKLGSMRKIETMLMSTVSSTSFYGLDWRIRAAMIARWREPSWHHKGRLTEGEFNLLRTNVMSTPTFQDLVRQTCEGLDGVRPHCRESARRGLFCDALTQTVAAVRSAAEIAGLLEEAAILRSDAKAIVETASVFDNLNANTQSILKKGQALSMQSWLTSGVSSEATLKVKFVTSHLFKDRAMQKCGTVFSDCSLVQAEAALCSSLQQAAASFITPELEAEVIRTAVADGADALDVTANQAYLAKFSEESVERDVVLAEEAEAAALDPAVKDLKRRVVSDLRFKSVVSRTCSDLAVVRPGCWDVAPSSLFCKALGRATLGALGPTRVIETMLKQLQVSNESATN